VFKATKINEKTTEEEQNELKEKAQSERTTRNTTNKVTGR
jgi:hypothetical protein